VANKKKEILTFNDEEKKLLEESTSEIGVDLENHSDIQDIPSIPDLSESELDKIVNDKSIKTIMTDVGRTPTIKDTLKDTDDIGKLTKEEIDQIKKGYAEEKEQLMMLLACEDSIKLHVYGGMKNGKSIWIEKEFIFNSIDKRQELQLNLLKARSGTLNVKYNVLSTRSAASLTEEEFEFLSKAQFMTEIAAYRLNEYEARLIFGMGAEDFSRVDITEYNIALQTYIYRMQNIPLYKRGRSLAGWREKSGTKSTR
jgi:hypothetical protein